MYMDVNYKGTVNLLDAIREAGINPRFHIAGSGEEYGEIHEDELPINDKSPLRPVNPYSVSKIAQDLIGYVYHRSYGMNVIRTRAFNHEGPRRDKVFGIPWYAYQVARIEAGLQEPIIKVGSTGYRRNCTHIRYLVEAYWLAMEKAAPGELYVIGADEPEHVYTFHNALEQLISMSNIGNQKIEIITAPEYVRPTQVPRLIADTQKFRDLTGWKPKINFETILSETLNYWRARLKSGTA
jgi:GDP-4-dehydro-6-deoxy-D-mannose reductase